MNTNSFRSDLADELIEEINKDDYRIENRKYKDIYISRVSILKDNNEFFNDFMMTFGHGPYNYTEEDPLLVY